MPNELSPAQMQKIAQHMSSMGRNGDTQLIHVMPEEVALLEAIGGSGSVNPHTGLKEFFLGTDYGGLGDMIDGGGPGGSGNTFDNDNDPDNEVGGIAAVSNSLSGAGHANDGLNDDNSRDDDTDYTYDSLVDLVDGGGKGMSGDTYGSGDFSSLDKNNDGHISRSEAGDGLPGGIDGNKDSVFTAAANVVGLVANPGAYALNKALGAGVGAIGSGLFGGGGGNSRPSNPVTNRDGGDGGGSRNSSSSSDAPTAATDAVATESGSDTTANSSLSGDFGYSSVSNFSNRLNGSRLIEYDYTDGTGRPVGTYNGNQKPFHIATSMENAEAYSRSVQGSNMIEQMLAEMPRNVLDQLKGNVSMFTTSDNKIALVAGDDSTGFIEATYDANEDGVNAAMGDVGAMLAYARDEGDFSIDAGFMGRVSSYQNYKGYATPSLYSEMNSLLLELQNYPEGSPQFNQASSALGSVRREISRRTRDGSETTIANSIDGVTDSIASSVASMFG